APGPPHDLRDPVTAGARSGWFVAVLAGFGAGLAGGLFGVGGGIVMVPVLTAFFGLTQHEAHGTSLAAVAATALAGIVVYGLSGPAGIAAALAVGAAVGLLAGYMGVGGGIIAVPALTLLFGMNQQTAQGTSLALILGSAPFGAAEHARLGNVVGRLLPGLMVG